MKKIISFILLGILSLSLTIGCSDEVTDEIRDITIEFEDKNYPFVENQSFIRIVTGNAWSAESNADWCTLSPTNGDGAGVIVVHLDENETSQIREAIITITSGSQRNTVTIRQSAHHAIHVDKDNIILSADANDKQAITITSSSNWEIVEEGMPSWISVNKKSGEVGATDIEISAETNTLAESRKADLCFKIVGDTTKTIVNIEQLGIHGTLRQRDSIALLDFFSIIDKEESLGIYDKKKSISSWTGVTTKEVNGVLRVVVFNFERITATIGMSPWPKNTEIPASLSYLTELQSLSLADLYAGTQFPECIKSLSKLTTLNLTGNNFTGELPLWIGDLTKLQYLHLEQNLLSGTLPATIGNLTGLIELQLGHNCFDAIPDMFTRLANLEVLGMFKQFKEINSDDIITSPTDNKEFPKTLLYLKKLRELRMHEASFTGSLPANISDISTLEIFTAYGNKFSGTIPEFTKCTNLVSINLSDNNFTGGIPASFGANYYLMNLYLRGNKNLGGTLPVELGQLNFLTMLDISECGLTGELPNGCLQGKGLIEVNLSKNALSGALPASLENCSSLEAIYIRENNFTSLGTGIRLCSRLAVLDVDANKLTTFPMEICNLPILTMVNLSNNDITGELPIELKSATNLQSLAIANNYLTSIAKGICEGHSYSKNWQWESLICPQKNGTLDVPEGAVLDPGGSVTEPEDGSLPTPSV
ncbi:MAG: leucine-rich repeat domain-containing protein [Marinifilaceae bacterium]